MAPLSTPIVNGIEIDALLECGFAGRSPVPSTLVLGLGTSTLWPEDEQE